MNAAAAPDATPGRGFPWLLTALSAVCLAILLALGTWQVQRMHWKEDLLATIDARIHAEPLPLAEVAAAATAGEDVEYVPVKVSGTFLHEREQFFFATHEGQSGWYVYTPLRADGGAVVLVNRGFVPYDRKEAALRGDGQVAGRVEVVGLARARLDGKPSSLLPDNQPAQNVFYWKDWAAMVANAGLSPDAVLPLFVDADRTPNPGGLPVGGVTIIDLPNRHLEYAVTWYGLALALFGVYIALVIRRMRAPAARP